ncbi:MAG: hypothetical protein Tsb0027_01130 [Wenzhouxiangellaceae bacterium]
MTEQTIAETLYELRQQHRDLDQAIAALAAQPSMDQLTLKRLKMQKLRLKDRIRYWQSKSIPDLDA